MMMSYSIYFWRMINEMETRVYGVLYDNNVSFLQSWTVIVIVWGKVLVISQACPQMGVATVKDKIRKARMKWFGHRYKRSVAPLFSSIAVSPILRAVLLFVDVFALYLAIFLLYFLIILLCKLFFWTEGSSKIAYLH